MNENTLWAIVGGFLVLMMGASFCTSGGGGEAGGRPSSGGGPEMGPGGRGPGQGADRTGAPEVRPGKPGRLTPGYEMLPVAGQEIPMGCAPVVVAPRGAEGAPGRDPGTVAGSVRNNFGARIKGNPSTDQMDVMQKGLAAVEAKYPGLTKGRDIFIFQSHEEYVRALQADGDSSQGARNSDAATSPDWRRIFFSPKAFEGGEKTAIYIIAHEFGHVQTRGGEGPADRFAEQLLGYSDPSKAGRGSGNRARRPQGQGGFVGILGDVQNDCLDCLTGWAA